MSSGFRIILFLLHKLVCLTVAQFTYKQTSVYFADPTQSTHTYGGAKLFCEGLGLQMATVHSVEEALAFHEACNYAADQASRHPLYGCWLGLELKSGGTATVSNDYYWHDGTKVTYTNWRPAFNGDAVRLCPIIRWNLVVPNWVNHDCAFLNHVLCDREYLIPQTPTPTFNGYQLNYYEAQLHCLSNYGSWIFSPFSSVENVALKELGEMDTGLPLEVWTGVSDITTAQTFEIGVEPDLQLYSAVKEAAFAMPWADDNPCTCADKSCTALKLTSGEWYEERCARLKPFGCRKHLSSAAPGFYDRFIFVDELKTWTAAEAHCVSVYGTHLAVIRSAYENAVASYLCWMHSGDSVTEAAATHEHCWIGFNDIALAFQWRWSNGDASSTYAFLNWADSEPSSSVATYNCASVHTPMDRGATFGQWTSNACDSPLKRFVCNYKPPTTGPTPEPTRHPSAVPTSVPSAQPTAHPTTAAPTSVPTHIPTSFPSTAMPSGNPTTIPSWNPSKSPSSAPSSAPSLTPTVSPTVTCPFVRVGVFAVTTTDVNKQTYVDLLANGIWLRHDSVFVDGRPQWFFNNGDDTNDRIYHSTDGGTAVMQWNIAFIAATSGVSAITFSFETDSMLLELPRHAFWFDNVHPAGENSWELLISCVSQTGMPTSTPSSNPTMLIDTGADAGAGAANSDNKNSGGGAALGALKFSEGGILLWVIVALVVVLVVLLILFFCCWYRLQAKNRRQNEQNPNQHQQGVAMHPISGQSVSAMPQSFRGEKDFQSANRGTPIQAYGSASVVAVNNGMVDVDGQPLQFNMTGSNSTFNPNVQQMYDGQQPTTFIVENADEDDTKFGDEIVVPPPVSVDSINSNHNNSQPNPEVDIAHAADANAHALAFNEVVKKDQSSDDSDDVMYEKPTDRGQRGGRKTHGSDVRSHQSIVNHNVEDDGNGVGDNGVRGPNGELSVESNANGNGNDIVMDMFMDGHQSSGNDADDNDYNI